MIDDLDQGGQTRGPQRRFVFGLLPQNTTLSLFSKT